MTDLEYLFQALGRDPTLDENYSYQERVGIIMNDGIGEDEAREIALKLWSKGK